jgi:branched-chain amino acid transport system permease protein
LFVERWLKDFRWGVIPVPGRLIAVIFFVLLFITPLITDNSVYLNFFIKANIFVIFAVSWDLLSGYTGQLNFGHALFFGVAAYSSGLMSKYLGWQPWATIPLSVLIAVAAGVLTCFPALRLRGPYLSLLTMAFPLMLAGIVLALKKYTGAEEGISGLPALANTLVGEYYICLLVMTVSVLIMWKLTDAGSRYIRTGLIFHAIREDEIAARATGINTIRYKLLAFAIGGFFAGIAGALYTHVVTSVGISSLTLTMSFQAIIWVIFGGIVSIYGAVVGVYTLYPLVYFSWLVQYRIGEFCNAIANTPSLVPLLGILRGIQALVNWPVIILAAIVILVLLFMPEGLAVWIRNKIERECPRCKLANAAWRRECRACSAPLH